MNRRDVPPKNVDNIVADIDDVIDDDERILELEDSPEFDKALDETLPGDTDDADEAEELALRRAREAVASGKPLTHPMLALQKDMLPELPPDDDNWHYKWVTYKKRENGGRFMTDMDTLMAHTNDEDCPFFYVKFDRLPPKYKAKFAQMAREGRGKIFYKDVVAMRCPRPAYDRRMKQLQDLTDYQMSHVRGGNPTRIRDSRAPVTVESEMWQSNS